MTRRVAWRVARRISRALAAALVVLVVANVVACRRGAPGGGGEAGAPTIVVRQDTEGLLMTWIDDKGDFHVETSVGAVPMMGRDAVRVVDPRDQATAQMTEDDVVVVDLRTPNADGVYPVRAMPRATFEGMAVARREKAGPTLANTGPPAAPAPTGGG